MKKSEFLELIRTYRINIGENTPKKLYTLLKIAKELNERTNKILKSVESDIDKYKKNTNGKN